VDLDLLEPRGISLSPDFFESLHGVFGRSDFIDLS